MSFKFKDKSSPQACVKDTVTSLQQYPIEEVLTASCLYSEWRPDLINILKDYLVPDKIRVHVVGKAFESQADSVEQWYGTKFRKEKIPIEQIEKWKCAGINEALHLPKKNEFIPTIFDIKPREKVS